MANELKILMKEKIFLSLQIGNRPFSITNYMDLEKFCPKCGLSRSSGLVELCCFSKSHRYQVVSTVPSRVTLKNLLGPLGHNEL